MRDGFKIFDADTHIKPPVEALRPYITAKIKERIPDWGASPSWLNHALGVIGAGNFTRRRSAVMWKRALNLRNRLSPCRRQEIWPPLTHLP